MACGIAPSETSTRKGCADVVSRTPTIRAQCRSPLRRERPDIEQLRAFYNGVFGWPIAAQGPGYASIETPDGSPNGALVEAADAGLTIGIVVPAIAAALEAAVECGGTIAMPATDNGWVAKAQIVDPAGSRITLIAG